MNKSFSPFLLKSILTLLINDEEYRDKFFPVLNVTYFNHEDKLVYTLASAIWSLHELYGKFPSVEVLSEELFTQKGQNINLWMTTPTKEERLAFKNFFLDIIEAEISDKKYVEDNTTKILGFLAVHKVILENKSSFIDGSLDIEAFTKEIVSASSFATPINLGVNLFADLDKRTENRNITGGTPGLVPVNIPHIASYLEEGGLPPGSLAFVLGSSGGGKSTSLIHISHDCAKAGLNVLYVSAELSEELIKKKFDSCLTCVPISDVRRLANKVKSLYSKSARFIATAERIQIVEVPNGVCKVSDIEVLIERLKKRGFVTNLLVVDYADNLKAPRKTDAYRHEVTDIYKELKALAQKHRLVCWTASQMNDAGTEASEKEGGKLTMRHMNESRGKIHLSDLCIGIARTQEEKDSCLGRLVLLKNRLGGGEGAVVQISTRYEVSRLFGAPSNVVPMSAMNLDDPIEGLRLETPSQASIKSLKELSNDE